MKDHMATSAGKNESAATRRRTSEMTLDFVTVGVSFHWKSAMMYLHSSSGRDLMNAFHSASKSPPLPGKVFSTSTSVISVLILRTTIEDALFDSELYAVLQESETAIPEAFRSIVRRYVGANRRDRWRRVSKRIWRDAHC